MTGQADVVAEQVDELNTQLPDMLVDLSVGRALELLATIRAARHQLYELEGIVERHAAHADGWVKNRHEADGVFAQRRRKAKSMTWFVDDTARAVVRTAEVDQDTGEVMPAEARPWVDRAVSALTNCAGIGYFRTTQLRDRGLDPDDYRSSLPGGWTVEVRIGDEEAAA